MTSVRYLTKLLFLFSVGLQTNGQAYKCYENVCEFNLVVRTRRTMTVADSDTRSGSDKPSDPDTEVFHPVVLNGSTLQALIPDVSCGRNGCTIIRKDVNASDVITASGTDGNVITTNNQFPAPTLEMMEGSQVTVHVRNLMDTLEMTLHFHGMFMQGSTWFDGVPDLSQTPIWPGQSFTYRFEATPSGTHWYHTHVPGTHVHGLYGLFIVHRRGPPLPPPVAELHMLVSDFWGREALVNGRGSQDGRPFPLATFHVQPGKAHLLRVVNSGDETPVKITIDNHLLRVVALDGVDVEPMEVDAVIMHVAERIDIELDANQNPEKYWIRIEAVPGDRKFQGGLAILEYSGAQVLSAPRSRRQECTSSRPCLVFNCLREAYPPNQFLRCINLHEARTAHAPDFQNKFALADPVDEEYFLSVQRTFGDSSINYVIFSPLSGAFFDPNNSFVECNQRSCQGYNSCRCTQVIPLRFNRTINLVIFSRDLYMAEALHPMHTHGHHMAVLAYGYPKIDTTTGRIQEFSRDIACESDFCVNPRWANGRPPVNLVNPPLKDTIAFPAGGYVIARIRSDNPGVWLFHCHITDHVRRGMRLIFEEAAERRPEPPSERPTWD